MNREKFNLIRLKNAMLFSNFIANIIGVSVVLFLTYGPGSPTPPEFARLAHRINLIFVPLSFILPIVGNILYERPIRRYLNNRFFKESVEEQEAIEARQRLLNEPFFLIALDFALWLTAAILYAAIFWSFGAGPTIIQRAFLRSFYTGLITTTVAFFVLEFVLQKRLVPYVFPNGGLYMTPRTLKIRIRTRLVALLFACNLIPFFTMLGSMWDTYKTDLEPAQLLERLQSSMLSQAMIFMAVGVWLTFLVSSNLTRPLQAMIQVLRNVRNGHFENKVRVTSNDEIGYTGDVINEMTEGLKERDFVKETFGKYVTKEIRDEILAGNVSLDGELKEVTVLFADLRNFTPMVETTPPREVVRIINGYFKEMEESIRQHHGLVLQYIGDEIEAVFGAPIFSKDHPLMAVRAALEMRKRLHTVNQDLERHGYRALAHGIGIHTGLVLAANIGSPDRLSYALIGDTVNLSSRLQDLNKEFGTDIIISAATRDRITGPLPSRELPATTVKGKSEAVKIFAL